ncbi:MAG: NAD(P)(+) transhydrogenase (Re/Si-specific) subunit beta [Krumholzibacteria bacterium]|nr:NAD(P)(+) transhydrogenase (Re/Si-specific) subunit beta [Candidatus Krumholzibacteria bacterium]
MPDSWVNLAYVAAAILFIVGLKGLTHPRTAVRGNLQSALGMLLAVVVTLLADGLAYQWILLGALIGGLVGGIAAVRVRMTQMPEMVALFNGFGGGASVLVAGAAFMLTADPGARTTVSTGLSGLIGSVTFTGSLIAFGKLAEILPGGQIGLPGLKAFNALMGAAALACVGWLTVDPTATEAYWIIVAIAGVLGVTLTIPIGGADMPVVISLLNSYSGLAAAATGFVLMNNVLIIAGSLVGASGIILTRIMCKAMNRSLGHVLFGSLGPGADGPSADDVYGGKVKATSPDEVAMLFDTARRVLFVPGYGLAVAQAQHVVKNLAGILEGRGIVVEYGIHPVAGRMPGHMNVLLAEADVPYEQLKEMDEINQEIEQVDVCMVIGANDVVNPVARTDPRSPIAGMPIIDVDKARTVVVVKRSLSPGFAGIPNPLFAADNCLMLFGDGKKALMELVESLKNS